MRPQNPKGRQYERASQTETAPPRALNESDGQSRVGGLDGR